MKLPDGKVLIPGFISHTTTLVEHPELIAQRLAQYADVVCRESVIAGNDCGFASQATHEPEIHPTVVAAKLKAIAELGAALASAAPNSGGRPSRVNSQLIDSLGISALSVRV